MDGSHSIGSVTLLAPLVAVVAGVLLYLGRVHQQQRGWTPDDSAPRWLYLVDREAA